MHSRTSRVLPGTRCQSFSWLSHTFAHTPSLILAFQTPAGLYPAAADEYEGLAAAIERLNLNDASVTVRKETSDALGAGFR